MLFRSKKFAKSPAGKMTGVGLAAGAAGGAAGAYAGSGKAKAGLRQKYGDPKEGPGGKKGWWVSSRGRKLFIPA